MNTNSHRVSTGLFAAGILTVAAALGLGGSASRAADVTATAAQPAPAAVSPLETWHGPRDVSNSPFYDNTSWVGAGKTNGQVTVGWEQRDVPNANYIQAASNTSLGGPFLPADELSNEGYKQNGNVRVRGDLQNNRYVTWWAYSGGAACGHFALLDPTGHEVVNQTVPGSCNNQKNVALAVGNDGVAHALFGWDLNNIGYYRREANGVWSVVNQGVPIIAHPKNIAVGVTTGGVVMAAYVDTGPAHTDIWTTTRDPLTGQWSPPEDISSTVHGNPAGSAHLPSLDADPFGGMRIAWTQVTRYDPNLDNYMDDVFYREWLPGTGWANQPVIQLTANSGNSYNCNIAVDAQGTAHIAWGDDTGRNMSNFEIYYAVGRGRTFAFYPGLFRQYFGNAYQKEPSVDTNRPVGADVAGDVHMSFSTVYADALKDTYYSYAAIDPTGPTPTPTNTPLPPTPTLTPTPCSAGNYSDVTRADYFYDAVRQLSLAGVVSGYSDCTFRPYNSITRGQAAKMVAQAANLPAYTPATPTFRDVPATNPFYTYIERAAHANVISGYNCGGVGEPCPGLYYRPNNNITRGQFSKVVVLAFHVTIITQGGPHFTDVPTTNPFYAYIETAYNNHFISGYADGTFRPNNSITRGQAAKIVFAPWQQLQGTATVTTTPVVVTATPTDTPVVVTATPTNTPIVVTATPTVTDTPTATAIP